MGTMAHPALIITCPGCPELLVVTVVILQGSRGVAVVDDLGEGYGRW